MSKVFDVAFRLGAELTGSFKSAFAEAGKSMKDLEKVAKKTGELGSAMTKGLTLPIVGLGAASVKTFASFDDGMREVQAITGASTESMQELRDAAKNWGSTTAHSASDVSSAMSYLGLAGYDTNQILGATPGILSLASASAMDLASASDIVTDTMAMFNMGASDAGRASDVFAKASSSTNTSVSQLGEAMKYAGGSAANMNMDLEQANTILGLFANQGLKGSAAGTTFTAMINDMRNKSKDGAMAIGDMSVALYDAQGNARDMGSIMKDIEGATNGMSNAQRDAALSSIFGTQAMKGVNALLTEGSDKYSELEKAMYGAEGAATEMAATMEGGIGGSLRALWSATEGLAIEFGEVLAPSIAQGADKLATIAQAFSGLSDESKKNIVTTLGVVAAIGPMLLVFSKTVETFLRVRRNAKIASAGMKMVGTAIKNLSWVQTLGAKSMVAYSKLIGLSFKFGGIKGAITGLITSVKSLSIALLTSPVFWIAAAIIGVGIAFAIAYKKSERFRNIVNGALEAVRTTLKRFIDYMKDVGPKMWNGLVEGVKGIGNKISSALQSEIAGKIGGVIGRVVDYFKEGFSSIPNAISMIVPVMARVGLSMLGVTGPIGFLITGVISLVGYIYRLAQTNSEVAESLSKAWGAIKDAFGPVIDVFVEGIEQFSKEVGPELTKTMEVIKDSVIALGPSFAELGATFAELGVLLTGMFMETISMVATEILPMLAEAFQTILPMILEVVQMVLPMIIEMILLLVPVVLEIVQVVLPMILEVAQMVFPMILGIVQMVMPIVLELITMIIPVVLEIAQVVLPMLMSIVQMVFPVIVGIIQAVIPVVIAILETLIPIINGVIIPAINGILQVVQVVFPFIQMIIQNALAIINGIIQTAMALLQGDWSGAWNAIKETAKTIMDNIISFFSSIDLFSVGKAIIDGLINGIKSMGGAVVGAIKGMVPEGIRGVVSDIIPGFADGGIVSSPTLAWVGEGGDTETVIPWNNSQRSKDLWIRTGQELGMLGAPAVQQQIQNVKASKERAITQTKVSETIVNSRSQGETTINIQNSPQYHITGGDSEEVKSIVERGNDDLIKKLSEIKKNERRLAFE